MVMDAGMPAVVAGGNGDGWGGGGAIWAIVLIALLGFNRHGDGGNIREATDNAELNSRFNSLENQIDNVANREDLRGNLMEVCKTNMNVTEQAYELSRQIDRNRFDTAIEFKNAELRAADCYKVA